jgi:hypothetical protein
MTDGITELLNPARTRVVMAGLALSMALATVDRGWAQAGVPAPGVQSSAQPPAEPQLVEQPPAQVARENPGLINEIGKLFEKSKSMLPPLKTPGEAMNDLSNIARPSLMVSGRAACVVASNGAPDCKVGADRLCQSKGFKEGRSLDTDASETCSPVVYLPGHTRGPNDCKTENFVRRAICQ